jgi:imidazolonepropionase
MTDCDLLIVNAGLATMAGGAAFGTIRDGALAVSNGRIAWVGARRDLSPALRAREELDGRGGWLTPGLIDCHTHLVYAGNRAREFERRLAGASYEDIAREGGGIQATVRSTRAASEEQLFGESEPRLKRLLDEGVTTVEIKSGYGLDPANELKLLRTARRLGAANGIDVQTTLLAAHVVPPGVRGPRRRLCGAGVRGDHSRGGARQTRRRRRCLLRTHRFLAVRNAVRLRRGACGRLARQVARRSALR